MPLDEEGNLVDQSPTTPNNERELSTIAPPGYGEHVLDQLYEDVDVSGFQTPGFQSGVSSPFYAQSILLSFVEVTTNHLVKFSKAH